MSSPLLHATRLHKALGHPARLRILTMLRDGELCVCQITAVLDLAVSTVSAHLAELRRAGLVTERKEGRWVYYSLPDDARVRGPLASEWPFLEADPQIKHDGAVLQQLRAVPVSELCHAKLDLEQLATRGGASTRKTTMTRDNERTR